jgi:hypothetical protein
MSAVIDDFYQAALDALRHHLTEAGAPFSIGDGAVLVDGHRLELSITFDGFVQQGEHTLAPVEIQIHVDGDNGERFRVGTLGVGTDPASATSAAIAEWHLLVVAPLLAALGAAVTTRREGTQPRQQLAGWDLFAGRLGIRGRVPSELRAGGAFFLALLERLRQVVAAWEVPRRFELRSIFFIATCGAGARDIQAAVDGLVDPSLTELLAGLPWPDSNEAYLYKQLFVLRRDGQDS